MISISRSSLLLTAFAELSLPSSLTPLGAMTFNSPIYYSLTMIWSWRFAVHSNSQTIEKHLSWNHLQPWWITNVVIYHQYRIATHGNFPTMARHTSGN